MPGCKKISIPCLARKRTITLHANISMTRVLFLPICLFLLFHASPLAAENCWNNPDPRSDSIDLTHCWITLDLSHADQKVISGNCKWVFSPKLENVQALRFDLLALAVDSVLLNNQQVVFQQTVNQVIIPLTASLSVNTINSITFYYHGSPIMDSSGWGGFYFSGSYAFNLGVGFNSDPHNFGRAWFPCFDNFTERSTYTFDVYTKPDQPAYCNGDLLTDETTPEGLRRRLWLLNYSIPSYLACVAIGPYTSFTRTYPGQNNPIRVEIAAAPGDTNKVRNTYQHLPQAIQAFEHWYGPFKWPKIGYSLVPFDRGAMEHATNISIGKAYVDGTLNYETLWAHELSHHWWGDLATCATAGDMWLNEGWANYSEKLFTEWLYGRAAYLKAVKDNFLDVLQNAHVEEGGYRAVSGVPTEYTYGKHVYNKGSAVAHNLRGYLGDSLFQVGIRSALEQTNFHAWSSADFREKLESATGENLHDFFDDWVFAPGFPDFLIDSIQWGTAPNGFLKATIFIRQKLRGAPHFHRNVPLQFTAVDDQGHKAFFERMVSGENSVAEVEFDPQLLQPTDIWVNTNLQLLQARTDGEKMLKTNGANFTDAKFNLQVNQTGADSVLFRVEHHFAAPDNLGANPNNYVLTSRFWQVYGHFPAGFNAQAVVSYDGRGQLDQLDTELFASTSPLEDSVLLLYRSGAGYPWQEWPDYDKITLGVTTDRFGQLRIRGLKAGQYTIGKGVTQLASQEPPNPFGKVQLYPNPSGGMVEISAENPFSGVQLIDNTGKELQYVHFSRNTSIKINVAGTPAGTYWVILSDRNKHFPLPVIIK